MLKREIGISHHHALPARLLESDRICCRDPSLLLCSNGPQRSFYCSERAFAASRRLHSVHDEEKPFELELAWICDESSKQFRLVPADLAAEAERQAKAALADSDM